MPQHDSAWHIAAAAPALSYLYGSAEPRPSVHLAAPACRCPCLSLQAEAVHSMLAAENKQVLKLHPGTAQPLVLRVAEVEGRRGRHVVMARADWEVRRWAGPANACRALPCCAQCCARGTCMSLGPVAGLLIS